MSLINKIALRINYNNNKREAKMIERITQNPSYIKLNWGNG